MCRSSRSVACTPGFHDDDDDDDDDDDSDDYDDDDYWPCGSRGMQQAPRQVSGWNHMH